MLTVPIVALLAVGDGYGVEVFDPCCGALHACLPGIRLLWADSGYVGKVVDWAVAMTGFLGPRLTLDAGPIRCRGA